MINFGNTLQSTYTPKVKSELLTNGAKNQLQKDRDAVKAMATAKREARMAKMDQRDINRVSELDKVTKEVSIEIKQIELKYGSGVKLNAAYDKQSAERKQLFETILRHA